MAEEKDEKIIQANKLKEEGNFFLTHHLYSSAVEKYTAALQLNDTIAIYYSNRAQAYIKLEQYGSAIEDANASIRLDPTYLKAYYRKASANYALGKLKEARKDLRTVVKIHPNDADALKKLKACEKAIHEEAFNKAIETEDSEATAIDFDAIVVESSYQGPRLVDDKVENIDIKFVKEMIEHLKGQKRLHKKYVLLILTAIREVLKVTPSLIRVNIEQPSSSSTDNNTAKKGHIRVCGDTHGQFYDLLNIFEVGDFPSIENPYIFNGDYVDRGSFSFEVVFTLLTIKLACPGALSLMRGNHETKNMNKMYGFEGEVLHKYDNTVMKLFYEVFSHLPLAAVIQDAVFVVHGGISTESNGEVSLDVIEKIKRGREPPETGLMSDLLWADPQPQAGRSFSKRGMGYSFGPDYTERFLAHNNLRLIVRSHEVKDEGYEVDHNGKCITVFSAPNYCDQMGNKGAMIKFDLANDLKPEFTQFSSVPHPHVPPMAYAGNVFGL